MDKVQTYTSTGGKFIHQWEAIRMVKKSGKGTPLSLQIAPTSECNLKCNFCSNVNRKHHEHLDPHLIIDYLMNMRTLGAKTVEWTGGGDPTMYGFINEMIIAAASFGYQQGFITNGVRLDKLSRRALKSLKWIRISMNALDYVPDIKIPKFEGTLGFSYVWNNMTDPDVIFERIRAYVEKYNASYVRVVPNCQATHEEQAKHNVEYAAKVSFLGAPFFYQPKVFKTPKNCYWGYFKPFLLHNGWIYPCSSVILNEEANRSFHEKYRWITPEEVQFVWDTKMAPFDPINCSHCVFCGQNELIQSLVETTGMEDFI